MIAYPEIGEYILALHILSSEADLPVGLVLVFLKISKTNLKDSVFESFGGNLKSKEKSEEERREERREE